MAASTKKVRGITIKLDADTSGIAEAYGKLITEVNRCKKALTDVNKLMVDATPEERTQLLSQAQSELEKAIEATSKKLEEEQKWLAELKKKDSTPEVERAMEALERQIIDDQRQLQKFKTDLANLGKEDTVATLKDKVNELNDKFETSKEKLKNIENTIATSRGQARLDALKQKQEELNNAYGLAKEKLETERDLLAELEKKDSTPEVKEEQEKLRKQIEKDEAEFKEFESAVQSWGSVSKQNALLVSEEFTAVGNKISSIGDNLLSTGRTLTTRVTTQLLNAGKSLVETATDFESAMAKVKSVTLSATDAQMEQLSNLATQLSEETVYSATEAADALYYMGLAGWSVEEMISALPNVLNLAAAGDMDLAEASDIVTDYTTAFGLSADESTRLVDVMAQTMANSNTSIEQMGQAFSYVAPVAGALGYTVEDVSFALGLMANNGIKGSKAGTSLRMMMSRLTKPTAETQQALDLLGVSLADEEGNMYSFKEILDQMRTSFEGGSISADELQKQIEEIDSALENSEITEEEYDERLQDIMVSAYGVQGAEKAKAAAQIAGTRAMSGMLAIVNTTTEDYDSLYKIIGQATGATEEIAAVMLDTTEGSMTKLKNQLTNIARELGEMLIPYIEKGIKWIKEMARKFRDLAPETKEAALKIAAITAAIGPLLLVGGTLVSGIGKLITTAGSLIAMFAAHPVVGTLTAVAAAVATVAVAVNQANKAHKEEIDAIYGTTEAEEELIEDIHELRDSYDGLVYTREQRIASAESEISHNEGLLQSLMDCADANGTIKEGMETRAAYIANELSEAYGIEIAINDGIISKYGEVVEAIQDVMEAERQKAIIQAYEGEYQEALANSTQAAYDLAEASYALNEATEDAEAATAAYNEELERQNKWVEGGGDLTDEETQYLRKLEEAMNSATQRQEELTAAYEEAYKVNQDYQIVLENYGEVMDAIASGDTERLNYAITKLTNNFKTSTTATREELQQQLTDFRQQYRALKQAVEDGMPGVTQEMVEQMALLVDNAQAELENKPWDLADHIKVDEQAITSKAKAMTLALKAGFNEDDLYAVGQNYVKGFANGIDSSISLVSSAATRMANKAKDVPNYILDIGSPSRVMKKTGRFFTEGFAIGITDREDEAIEAASQLAKNAMGAMNYTGSNFSAPVGASAGSVTNTTYGNINVTVNGANTSNADELADIIAEKINREITTRRFVTA